jgi:glycosyltransferase involved in cell wall biosynthesis
VTELRKFKKTEEKISLKYGKKYLIGYVGTMGKQEGIDFLLGVMDFIINRRKRIDIHLTCIGGGPALDYLRNLTYEKKLSHFVDFPGRVSDEYLLDVLSTSDVCVNPDAPSELNDKSTMIKIMEYMALKKPIVQFDFCEGKYSAQKSSLYAKKGDIKDFSDKILFLLDNPELRKKMGEYGYTRIKDKLEWKFSIPNLLEAYENVLK